MKECVINNMSRFQKDADVIDGACENVQENPHLEDGWADPAPGGM